MKLEGSLDAFSLPDVFQLLSLTKKSGALQLRQGTLLGLVHFRDGMICGASADLSRQSLVRRIVGQGLVDDAALARAVDRALGEPIGVTRALVQAGAVDAEIARGLAREQTIDAVFDLLRWPEGDFSFAIDEPDTDDVGLELTTDQVVTEAADRRARWDEVSLVIPSPNAVLTAPVIVSDEQLQDGLAEQEWSLLALVDGRRSVGELVELSGAGQFGVVATAARLVGRGLVEVHDEAFVDHVDAVRAQHTVIAALEQGAPNEQPAVEEPPASPPPAVETVAPGPLPESRSSTQLVAPLVAAPGTGPASPPAELAAAPPAASPAPEPAAAYLGAHQPQAVVPPRPEPFLPSRAVAHPEPQPAGYAATVSAGSSAAPAQPAAAHLIERDPSVNRSLLLRLIAGVRGL